MPLAESIGAEAFTRCRIREASFPKLKKLGTRAFLNCETLEKLKISASTEVIGKNAFSGCDKYSEVFYGGMDKRQIDILEGNEKLLNGTWHFGYKFE